MRVFFAIGLKVFLLACGDSGFQGASSQVDPSNRITDQDSTDQIGIPKLDLCDETLESGITEVELLSDSIALEPIEKSIRYSLSLRDCEGILKPLEDVAILFDINATVTPFASPIKYRVLNANETLVLEGQLSTVEGRDLFGNVGSFAFWQTENVNFEDPETSLILEVVLDAINISPRDDLEESALELLPTYLRIADARPIQANVRFKSEVN